MKRLLRPAIALACACALAALPAATTTASAPSVYLGLGTWVDIFDGPVFSSIPASVAKMKRKGVRTIYVETANAGSARFVRKAQVGELLETAHDNGLKVVAWTLPGHTDQADDRAKAFAAINFTSPRGDHFNGFALDIESTAVRSISKRNQRLLKLSSQIAQEAQAVGRPMPLGAITFSPVFIDGPWPGFPWQQLAPTYDVFLPMAYSSYHYNTGNSVRTYTKRAVRLERRYSGGKPVHVIGGIANAMGANETKGFVRAVLRTGAAGGSLYDFRTTGKEDWRYLKRL